MWENLQAVIEAVTDKTVVVTDIHFDYEEVTTRDGTGIPVATFFVPSGVSIQVDVR